MRLCLIALLAFVSVCTAFLSCFFLGLANVSCVVEFVAALPIVYVVSSFRVLRSELLSVLN